MKDELTTAAVTAVLLSLFALTPPPASQTCDLPDYTDRYDRRLRTAVQFYWPLEQQDWCWFKAQAIAESGLDPAARSAAGAQGLLQIMPATWHDLQATLPQPGDALTVPANIIQGARYMARMQDVWIAQRPAQCRLELAQASYNAGAGHVLKAQGLAGGARCWDQIGPQLQQVTGHHAQETTHYVARIGALRRQMP